MSSILIKTRTDSPDPATAQDGDILCAFSRREVQHKWGEIICHQRRQNRQFADMTDDGLIDNGALVRAYKERFAQCRFERLSRHEADIVRLSDGARHRIKSNVPFDNPFTPGTALEAIDIGQFVNRRLKTLRLQNASGIPIFGEPGREIWYGGSETTRDQSRVDLLWDDIEAKHAELPRTHALFQDWPYATERGPVSIRLHSNSNDRLVGYFAADRTYRRGQHGDQVSAIIGGQELRSFWAEPIDDLTDDEADELTASETEDGEADPETGIVRQVVVKKRKHNIAWRDLPKRGKYVTDILDPTVYMKKLEELKPDKIRKDKDVKVKPVKVNPVNPQRKTK